MTEATIKQDLVTYLRGLGAVVFRHEDLFAAGVPDLSVTFCDSTTWIEAKLIKQEYDPMHHTIEIIMKKYKNGMIQLETIRRLHRASNNRAWISVWFLHKCELTLFLWSPSKEFVYEGKSFNKIQEIVI